MVRTGRHVARRVYPGVGVREVILAGSAILLAGSIMAGTVLAERYGPNIDGLVPTTVTAPTMTPSTPTSGTTSTATTTAAGEPGPAGAPGAAGPSGPPGPAGATVTVPLPPVTAPPTTLPTLPTLPPTTLRVCISPPSAPHPGSTLKPCLPR